MGTGNEEQLTGNNNGTGNKNGNIEPMGMGNRNGE